MNIGSRMHSSANIFATDYALTSYIVINIYLAEEIICSGIYAHVQGVITSGAMI